MQFDPESNCFIGSNKGIIYGHVPLIIWHITDLCPLDCPYCFSPKSGDCLDPTHITNIVNTLKDLLVQKVDISGGEPLLYQDLSNICLELWQQDIHLTITTNGKSTPENRNFIIEHAERFSRVIFSLDAPNIHHDLLRGHPFLFDSVIELISKIDPIIRSKKCRINTVVTKPFVENGWLKELAQIVDNLSIREWCLIQPHPSNKKSKFDQYSISSDELINQVSIAREQTKQVDIIYRDFNLYSKYWVLHPGGVLRQHTEGPFDSIGINLVESSIYDINNFLSNTLTEVPYA